MHLEDAIATSDLVLLFIAPTIISQKDKQKSGAHISDSMVFSACILTVPLMMKNKEWFPSRVMISPSLKYRNEQSEANSASNSSFSDMCWKTELILTKLVSSSKSEVPSPGLLASGINSM
jgi:hypothetical protein